MWFILFLVFGFLFVAFPVVRCAVCHPVSLTVYGLRDLFKYFRNREYNFCGSGELVGYTGLFGKGKTLTAAFPDAAFLTDLARSLTGRMK